MVKALTGVNDGSFTRLEVLKDGAMENVLDLLGDATYDDTTISQEVAANTAAISGNTAALATKADAAATTAALATKADDAATTAALALKANDAATTAALATKADAAATKTALNGKIDDSQVLTNVPAGAMFTDTPLDIWHSSSSQYVPTTKVYYENSSLTLDAGVGSPTLGAWFVKAEPGISDVTGLQAALNGKVDDNQVLTNVPANASFTDTIYTHPATHSISEVNGLQAALNGKVDDSQVLTNVPANASFMDTIYTHPTTHSIAEVSGLQAALDGKPDDAELPQIQYLGNDVDMKKLRVQREHPKPGIEFRGAQDSEQSPDD